MCSFITQHNATGVTSFQGACNWHADCRNVHQSYCPWTECSFHCHKLSPVSFLRIWQYLQLTSQLQTMCDQPRTSTSGFFTCKIVWDQQPRQLMQQLVCTTKEFLHKLFICVLVILTRVFTWLQIVTDQRGQMLTFDGVWHFGEVFSSRINPGLHCTGQMTSMASCGQAVW